MSRFVQQALVCEGPSVTRQPSPCASHGLMVRRLRSSQEAQLDVDSYTQMQSQHHQWCSDRITLPHLPCLRVLRVP